MRVTRAAGAAVTTVVLLLAVACGEDAVDGRSDTDTGAAVPDDGGSTSGAPVPGGEETAQPTAPVVDPDYAVDPPGPLDGPLSLADILVVDQEPVSDEDLASIEQLEGVGSVERISIGQVSLENKVYTVAAVDPATYRPFAPKESADLQAQWDRVAGGELALSPELKRRAPLDDEGFLELDLGEGSERIHVGAYAPQIEQVDAIVNEKWGEALGMTMGNAVVVSTGQTAPDTVRKPLVEAIGNDVSVQNLDAVARFGLDTDAFQTAVLVGTLADAVGTFNYTPIGGGRVAPDPAWVSSHISTQVVPILGAVTCNNAIFPQLKAALSEVVAQGLEDEINPDEYAGCYYPRFIAGSTTLSNHSFGTALDFNVPGNLRGTVGEMDRGVVSIFKRWGFGWGGDWAYTDPMHFELRQIVRPG